MIVFLHGRELQEGDILESKGHAGIRVKLLEITYKCITCDLQGLPVRIRVPLGEVEENFSWPEEVPDTQAELQRYYDTVITDMCKGTTVKPWECVRQADTKIPFTACPKFVLSKTMYEFALTVHLNRPVWVGSVLYVGKQDCGDDVGSTWEVLGLTDEGHLKAKRKDSPIGITSTVWRNWAAWEKPVKQKAPTRVKVGYGNYVTVPGCGGVAGRSVRLEFTTHKDAVEFYEVFYRLKSEKEA